MRTKRGFKFFFMTICYFFKGKGICFTFISYLCTVLDEIYKKYSYEKESINGRSRLDDCNECKRAEWL